jgi:hypothetical protein
MSEKMEIGTVLKKLLEERPLFFSEADFQFALAWKIKQTYETAKIQLEHCVDGMYIDIIVEFNGKKYPIELKYKTKAFCCEFDGETYGLTNQSAQNLGRYDYLKDIGRIERLRDNKRLPEFEYGMAIILTNDPSYWDGKKTNKETMDKAFRISDGENPKHGIMEWGKRSKKTTKERSDPIILDGTYPIKWENFNSKIKESEPDGGEFRYLIAKIDK